MTDCNCCQLCVVQVEYRKVAMVYQRVGTPSVNTPGKYFRSVIRVRNEITTAGTYTRTDIDSWNQHWTCWLAPAISLRSVTENADRAYPTMFGNQLSYDTTFTEGGRDYTTSSKYSTPEPRPSLPEIALIEYAFSNRLADEYSDSDFLTAISTHFGSLDHDDPMLHLSVSYRGRIGGVGIDGLAEACYARLAWPSYSNFDSAHIDIAVGRATDPITPVAFTKLHRRLARAAHEVLTGEESDLCYSNWVQITPPGPGSYAYLLADRAACPGYPRSSAPGYIVLVQTRSQSLSKTGYFANGEYWAKREVTQHGSKSIETWTFADYQRSVTFGEQEGEVTSDIHGSLSDAQTYSMLHAATLELLSTTPWMAPSDLSYTPIAECRVEDNQAPDAIVYLTEGVYSIIIVGDEDRVVNWLEVTTPNGGESIAVPRQYTGRGVASYHINVPNERASVQIQLVDEPY